MQGTIYKVYQSVFDLMPIYFDSLEDFENYRNCIGVLGFTCDVRYSYNNGYNVVNCYLLRRH